MTQYNGSEHVQWDLVLRYGLECDNPPYVPVWVYAMRQMWGVEMCANLSILGCTSQFATDERKWVDISIKR